MMLSIFANQIGIYVFLLNGYMYKCWREEVFFVVVVVCCFVHLSRFRLLIVQRHQVMLHDLVRREKD